MNPIMSDSKRHGLMLSGENMNALEKLLWDVAMTFVAMPVIVNVNGNRFLILDCRPEITSHDFG
jgi:hypothetical protein